MRFTWLTFSSSTFERAFGNSSGVQAATDDEPLSVLPEGIRGEAARSLYGLGSGSRAVVPIMPMGLFGKSAAQGLVAKLRLNRCAILIRLSGERSSAGRALDCGSLLGGFRKTLKTRETRISLAFHACTRRYLSRRISTVQSQAKFTTRRFRESLLKEIKPFGLRINHQGYRTLNIQSSRRNSGACLTVASVASRLDFMNVRLSPRTKSVHKLPVRRKRVDGKEGRLPA